MTHDSTRPVRSRSLRPWLGALLACAALSPSLVSLAGEEEPPPVDPRARVLARIPADATVLINVTERELPASPDILNLGRKSTAALARCLSDNVVPQLRSACADMLAALGDPAALPTLRAALDDWDADVRHAVVRALARIPDAASLAPLVRVFAREDEEERVRSAALDALGALGIRGAVQELRAELRKPQSPYRLAAFAALWRSRHLVHRATLEGDLELALRSSEPPLVLRATEAAAELRSPRLTQALIALVEHPHAEIRNKAVYALGRIGDRAAVRALQARLPRVREARMLNNIAFALERLDPRTFLPAVESLATHKQAIIRLNAAYVLGDVRRSEGRRLLERALEDPNDYVKTSAVVALGKLGAPEAAPLLERFVEHPNPSLREEALHALFALGGKQRADLVYTRLFAGPREAPRRRAALALARVQDPRVQGYLLACLEQWSCSLRDVQGYLEADASAAVAERVLLGYARGRGDFVPLLAKLRPPGTLPVALASFEASLAMGDRSAAAVAADLLGDLGDRSATERLARRAPDPQAWLRVRVDVALARLGDTSADARLLATFDDAAHEHLPELARSLGRIREKEARARLAGPLGERSRRGTVPQQVAAAAVLFLWDAESGFHRMLDALASDSVLERELAAGWLLRDEREAVTWLLRRALAREGRLPTRDRLRVLLDQRGG